MTVDKEFLKTTEGRDSGTSLLLSRATPRPSSTWAHYTSTVRAVSRDDRESAHWFKLAADQGQAEGRI